MSEIELPTQTITPVTLEELEVRLVGKDGLVFIGCGGEAMEWVQGITKTLIEEKVYKPVLEWYTFSALIKGVSEPITMLVMPLKHSDVGKLCIWRLKFGDCSWWSDFRRNYKPRFVAPEAQQESEDE